MARGFVLCQIIKKKTFKFLTDSSHISHQRTLRQLELKCCLTQHLCGIISSALLNVQGDSSFVKGIQNTFNWWNTFYAPTNISYSRLISGRILSSVMGTWQVGRLVTTTIIFDSKLSLSLTAILDKSDWWRVHRVDL